MEPSSKESSLREEMECLQAPSMYHEDMNS